ncbi:hypothetical protein [Bacillus licheniformis]|uniref:hypothetical protein n=1 Tax=Bacillus licheniformis TaxID=1402 RepID=UPI002DBD04E7|nr:hypothetical protein [Bacillus licheniformis]MEC0490206.1 hypothetical protein [Bacillus licheniformis]
MLNNEELTNQELLQLYRVAIEELPGSGARGRSWLAQIEAEIIERMGGYEEDFED